METLLASLVMGVTGLFICGTEDKPLTKLIKVIMVIGCYAVGVMQGKN